jgi:hypothetical protein
VILLVVGGVLGFASRGRTERDPAAAYASGASLPPVVLRAAEGLPVSAEP